MLCFLRLVNHSQVQVVAIQTSRRSQMASLIEWMGKHCLRGGQFKSLFRVVLYSIQHDHHSLCNPHFCQGFLLHFILQDCAVVLEPESTVVPDPLSPELVTSVDYFRESDIVLHCSQWKAVIVRSLPNTTRIHGWAKFAARLSRCSAVLFTAVLGLSLQVRVVCPRRQILQINLSHPILTTDPHTRRKNTKSGDHAFLQSFSMLLTFVRFTRCISHSLRRRSLDFQRASECEFRW